MSEWSGVKPEAEGLGRKGRKGKEREGKGIAEGEGQAALGSAV